MKKLSVFAVAALALAFASCTQEMDFTPSDPSLTVLTATHLSTRSALEQTLGGTLPSTILWDAPDQIMVGYAGTALSTFVSDNTTPASEADFTGHLPEGSGPLYSIYPVNEGNAVSADGVFTVTFKGEQTAVEGSYDPEAFPSVAVSDTKELSFQNICGLLVLKVGYDDVTGISLSGAAAGDVFCGGAMTVELEGGVPVVKGGTEDLTEIVLNAPGAGVFSTDKTYYMAVPPCSLPGGAVFTLARESGETVSVSIDGPLSVERSKVYEVKTLEAEVVTEPLTFEILENGKILWKCSHNKVDTDEAGNPDSVAKTIEYKINDGSWTSLTSTYAGAEIAVSKGDKVQVRGNNSSYYSIACPICGYGVMYNYFSMPEGKCNVSGNIMSLINATDYSSLTSLDDVGSFCFLFLRNVGITSAENLVLPATTLAERRYSGMFYGCTSLTAAPELPATTLAEGCYSDMFGGCTSLTVAPELPATTLAEGCYSEMFAGCTSLNYISCLAKDILADGCTSLWVSGVSSTGTFVKNAEMTSWASGSSGIPSGWTVTDK